MEKRGKEGGGSICALALGRREGRVWSCYWRRRSYFILEGDGRAPLARSAFPPSHPCHLFRNYCLSFWVFHPLLPVSVSPPLCLIAPRIYCGLLLLLLLLRLFRQQKKKRRGGRGTGGAGENKSLSSHSSRMETSPPFPPSLQAPQPSFFPLRPLLPPYTGGYME